MFKKFHACYGKTTTSDEILQTIYEHEPTKRGGVFSGDPDQMCDLVGYLAFSNRVPTVVLGGDSELTRRISTRFSGLNIKFHLPEAPSATRVVYVDKTPWTNRSTEFPTACLRWYFTRCAELLHLEHARKVFHWLHSEHCVEDALQIGRRREVQVDPVLVVGTPLRWDVRKRTYYDPSDVTTKRLSIDWVCMCGVVKDWWAKPTKYSDIGEVVFTDPRSLKMTQACVDTLSKGGFKGRVAFVQGTEIVDVQELFAQTLFRSADEVEVLRRIVKLQRKK